MSLPCFRIDFSLQFFKVSFFIDCTTLYSTGSKTFPKTIYIKVLQNNTDVIYGPTLSKTSLLCPNVALNLLKSQKIINL